MAKKKTTDDFDLDMKLPDIKRSQIADEKTVNKAVETMATVDGEPVKSEPTKKASTSKSKAKTPSKKAQPKEDALAILPKKRLTVDIPHYMNEALREYTYKNRVTIKDVIHGCLHDLLKLKEPK
jgi:hypothetical protein